MGRTASVKNEEIDGLNAINWPERFKSLHGRNPRVLHICNIANYAWVNASIMRRHNVDSVVLDPDFFHVASSPEWLEAHICGGHGDDFYPDWAGAKVHGFKRPDWYLNGPTPFVMRELVARQSSSSVKRFFFMNPIKTQIQY
jgi:hypothetical protein